MSDKKVEPLRWSKPHRERGVSWGPRPEVHEIRRGGKLLGDVTLRRRALPTAEDYYVGRVRFGSQDAHTYSFPTADEAKKATKALVLECEAKEAALPPLTFEELDPLYRCYQAFCELSRLDHEAIRKTLDAIEKSPHRLYEDKNHPTGYAEKMRMALLGGGYQGGTVDIIKSVKQKLAVK